MNRKKMVKKALEREVGSPPQCYWLSFADPDLPKGSQFLGVVITNAVGVAHAMQKCWDLGCNPGGQVMAYPTDAAKIPKECFDRLLSKQELIDYDFI